MSLLFDAEPISSISSRRKALHEWAAELVIESSHQGCWRSDFTHQLSRGTQPCSRASRELFPMMANHLCSHARTYSSSYALKLKLKAPSTETAWWPCFGFLLQFNVQLIASILKICMREMVLVPLDWLELNHLRCPCYAVKNSVCTESIARIAASFPSRSVQFIFHFAEPPTWVMYADMSNTCFAAYHFLCFFHTRRFARENTRVYALKVSNGIIRRGERERGGSVPYFVCSSLCSSFD